MAVTIELLGITNETEANHAMAYCELEECRTGIFAIGMIDKIFGSLATAKTAAEAHNLVAGLENHPVKLVLKKLER